MNDTAELATEHLNSTDTAVAHAAPLKVLLVEDELKVAQMLIKGLTENGFAVEVAHTGTEGLAKALEGRYDVFLLDLMLPGMTGTEICKKLRSEKPDALIMMLTALNATEHVVSGLDSGADDYITKPFAFSELIARIRALVRRKELSQQSRILRISDLELDLDKKEIRRGDRKITLTAKEFALLRYFLENKGRVLSRSEIAESVWDITFDTGTNVIDVYVNYLRNKVDKGFNQRLIHTVVGMGYVLKE